jgi:epoxyqueuosine reductase
VIPPKEQIRELAIRLGFDACGITNAEQPKTWNSYQDWIEAEKHGKMEYLRRHSEKKGDISKVLPSVKSVISLAISYHIAKSPKQPLVNAKKHISAGLIAQYAQHEDYHDALKKPLNDFCDQLNSLTDGDHQHLAYVDTGPIMERDLAQRAGLGFAGKHTNLINRSLGNWFFIAEILTTLPLEPDEPERNRCGTCTRCLHACPTNAIEAPFKLDARKCISYLTIELKGAIPEELRPAIGNRIFGCDDCLEVCPWNRFAKEGALMKKIRRNDLNAPELIRLLKMDQPTFKSTFAGSPILRSKRKGFLRNVCVALGNTGTREAIPALKDASLDSEPLIAEHAQWAIQRIESRFTKATKN